MCIYYVYIYIYQSHLGFVYQWPEIGDMHGWTYVYIYIYIRTTFRHK